MPRSTQNNFDYADVNKAFSPDKKLYPVDQTKFKDYYFNEEENVKSFET